MNRQPASAHQDKEPTTPTVEEVVDLLRARGERVTTSRRMLLEVLFDDTSAHLTAEAIAEAIHQRAPDVHITTVYRNLEELERLGIVIHSHLGHGPATYQVAAVAHAHLLCEGCGATIEVPESFLAALVRQTKSEFGFELDIHHFGLPGWCQECSARKETKPGEDD